MPLHPHRFCRRRHAAALLVLGALFAGPPSSVSAAPAADTPQRTRASHTMKNAVAALADEVYLNRIDAAVQPLAMQAATVGFEGLVLGAPKRVDAGKHAAFSALVLTARSASRSRKLPWNDNAMLVATDVARGSVFAGAAVVVDASKIREPAAPPEPPAPPIDPALEALGEGRSAGTMWLDVPGLLNLPQRTARWVLRVVYFDQVSDPATVDVMTKLPVEGGVPQAAAKALVERIRAAGPSAHGLPVYRASAATPTLSGPGIAATVAPLGGGALALHVALRVEVSKQMLVDKPAKSGSAGEARPPSALLKSTLLIAVRNTAQPFLLNVDIPVWSERELQGGELVDAAFSIDLASMLPAAALQSGAQLYVLAGRHIAGPQALVR